MRISIGIVSLACGAAFFPVGANAAVTACDLLHPSDIERIVGRGFSGPLAKKLDVCAGLCDSVNGTRCTFEKRENGRYIEVSLDVSLPPWWINDWLRVVSLTYKWPGGGQIFEVHGMGAPAILFFQEKVPYALLNIIDGKRIHFVLREEGIANQPIALKDLKALGRIVLARSK